ncbi:hypothetical protein INT48_000085, partial [Thamnidium elegans]
MEQSSELEKAKNRFEIEERILAVLSDSEDIDKFNNLRSKDIISPEERLKSTTKREAYWNQLVNQFISKHFPHLMNTQQQQQTSSNNSDLIRIAEFLAEVAAISAANKKDFDFIEKPSRYAHIIDAWIQAIDDYSNLKDYTDTKKCQLAIALLLGSARVWYSNLRVQEKVPTDWLSFRRELLSFFKPENYVSLSRDRIRALRQTTTISNYVKDFLSIKLSIPAMTDDEAVDKFLAGLKDHQARIHIKDVINMEFPVLSDVLKAAYIYEVRARHLVAPDSKERILAVLSDSEDIEKFNNLRSKDIISTEERLKSTTKREAYWNQLVNQFISKHFPHLMNTQQQQQTSSNNSDLIRIAELLAEVAAISAANKKDFDFIEKPSRYDGSRDAHIIDAWIQAIDDYSNLKDYTDTKKCQLAIALLSGSARVWYSNLRVQERAPTDWLSFRRELLSFFKPENYISLARDRIRALRQTATISNYVKDFLSIKLSIPAMTDDEAVDKFLAGLKDHQARIHIKDVINMEFPVLSDVLKAAYIYEGNREEGIPIRQHNRSSNQEMMDDPMDLSVAEKREFLNAVRSFRGNYRGSTRGGYRGHFRGSYNRNNSRGGFVQSHGNSSGNGDTRNQSSHLSRSNSIKCYNCKGFGHIAKDCSSPRINDIHYMENSYDD